MELTHNWDTESYDLGDAYGHIAIEVDDAYAACERVKEMGGKSGTRSRSDETRHDCDCVCSKIRTATKLNLFKEKR